MSSERFNKGNEHFSKKLELKLDNFKKDGKSAPIIFGRDPDRSEYIFEDDAVSGAHFSISYVAVSEAFMISDLGSRNGTRVESVFTGETKVLSKGQAMELPNDSIIIFGSLKYQVLISGDSNNPVLTLLLV